MEPTRAAIAAIQNRVKGELSLLVEEAEALDDEAGQDRFNQITAGGVWEALYTLADAIDASR